MTITIPSGRILPLQAKAGGGFASSALDLGSGGISPLVQFDFGSGDTKTSASKNDTGFSWGAGPGIATAPNGRNGVKFTFGPDGPAEDSRSELRYSIGQSFFENYERFKLYIPSNFQPRLVVELTVDNSADVSTWQAGDIIESSNTPYAGPVLAVDGATVYLKNPYNGLGSPWSGTTITNTTRGGTANCTNGAFLVYNNKFSAQWNAANTYESSQGGNTIIEYDPSYTQYTDPIKADARMFYGGTDIYSAGGFSTYGTVNVIKPMIDPAIHNATEVDFVIYRKRATSLEAEDAEIKVWTNGDLVFTGIGGRNFHSTDNTFANGYILGAANTGFEELTEIFMTLYEFYGTSKPGGLE